MKKVILFIIFIIFIFSNTSLAETPREIFRQANLNYENEEYEEAISLYEELVEKDSVALAVFYNLGNSYFKLRKIGKSILNYERALRLAPRDREVRVNLKLAKGMIVDKIQINARGFLLDMVLFLYDRMSVNELTVIGAIFYFSIISILVFSIFLVTMRRRLFVIASSLGLGLALFTIFLVAKIHSENFVKSGILLSSKVDVRSGPSKEHAVLFTLHEGTKVRILEERRSWYEIDLSGDLRGWLPKDTLEKI